MNKINTQKIISIFKSSIIYTACYMSTLGCQLSPTTSPTEPAFSPAAKRSLTSECSIENFNQIDPKNKFLTVLKNDGENLEFQLGEGFGIPLNELKVQVMKQQKALGFMDINKRP